MAVLEENTNISTTCQRRVFFFFLMVIGRLQALLPHLTVIDVPSTWAMVTGLVELQAGRRKDA